MIKAVVFDLYGTLLQITQDSRPFVALARRTIDRRMALDAALLRNQATLADFADFIGLQQQHDIAVLQLKMDDDIRAITPFGDALVTLRALKQRGVKTAVVSNLATPYKQPFFRHGFDDVVDIAVFSCDCGQRKPNPAIYELAVRTLRCEPDEMLMVGDSFRCDVEGPSRMGMRGCHLVRDGRSSLGPNVITSLQALLDDRKPTT